MKYPRTLLILPCLLLTFPRDAGAGWRLHLQGSGSVPVAGWQGESFGPGAGGGAAFEYVLGSRLGLEVAAGYAFASPGDHAPSQGAAATRFGSWGYLAAGLRLRPFGRAGTTVAPWIDLLAGAGPTGHLVRPVAMARLGVAFPAGPVTIGPWVGYARVLQTDATDLAGDAGFALAGLELSFGSAGARPAPALVPGPPHPRCPAVLDPGQVDADRDGCPDPDRDLDAQVQSVDRCPDEPETVNGVADDDGCTDAAPVRVVHGRIILDEQIHFYSASARVRPESMPIVAAVARVLQSHPEYGRLSIEGHADDVGTNGYNLRLSFRRARSVAGLVAGMGIGAERVDPLGYGRRVPLVAGTGSRARAANRRVEFVVDGHRSAGLALTRQGPVVVEPPESLLQTGGVR